MHGGHDEVLDAPWHGMHGPHFVHVNPRRATHGLERSTSTIPLNASDGESGSDLGRAFGFSFFLLLFSFYYFMSCSISTKIFSVRCWELKSDGVAVFTWTTQPGAPVKVCVHACVRLCSVPTKRGLFRCHYQRGKKEKRDFCERILNQREGAKGGRGRGCEGAALRCSMQTKEGLGG